MAFGGFNDSGSSSSMSDINMVPLIDVMLVLLIVFMITAPLLTHSVPIDLPTASTETTSEEPDTIALAIDGDGQFYWNDEPVDRDEAVERLEQAAAQAPQPNLHLRADRDTRYQTLADIMSEARRAGIERMGFITTPE